MRSTFCDEIKVVVVKFSNFPKMEHDRAVGPGEFDLEDPNLEEKLVNELKSQGIFDQFRKDCLSDVDTKVRISLSF